MPHCEHCESFVTAEYVRVLGVEGEVHACPNCEDRSRSAAHEGGWRSTSSSKEGGEYTTYDPAYVADGGSK